MKKMTEKAMRRVNGGWWLIDMIKEIKAMADKRQAMYDEILEATRVR